MNSCFSLLAAISGGQQIFVPTGDFRVYGPGVTPRELGFGGGAGDHGRTEPQPSYCIEDNVPVE